MPSGVGDTRMPISPSFVTTISRCSSRTPSSSISPPAMPHAMRNVPASMRSPMISVSHGTSSSTPSIRIVLVPAPRMCAPMRLRNAARSVISGSRAAFSMTVSPLASTAAVMQVLGRADAREVEHDARARAACCSAPRRSRARPRAPRPSPARPRKCMSSLRLPMLSPPGSATRASPQRASSGPSTLIDARIRLTSSYGASGVEPARRVDRAARSGPAHSTSAPTARSTSIITSRSATGGEVAHDGDARREQGGRQLLQPGVLRRTRDLDRARERRPGPYGDGIHRAPRLAARAATRRQRFW